MIREFDGESSSHQTASSAQQSAIFAFSAENSKIVRTLAGFPFTQGTGEAHIRASAADSCPILSVENQAVPFRRSFLLFGTPIFSPILSDGDQGGALSASSIRNDLALAPIA
jgi:hypothetical protein